MSFDRALIPEAQRPPLPGLARRVGPKHVTIVMATFNGGWTIDAQLTSIARQSHTDWSLIVSDDGSTDDTVARVQRFAALHPERKIITLRGPGKGAAMNFLSLLRAAGGAAYLAFADQDDYWLPDRLSRGLAALDGLDRPAIYGSRTVIADHDLTPLRLSPAFVRPTGFRNALVQNVAGGNTMLLNRKALDLLQPASSRIDRLIAHDWWAYQLVTAAGGEMILDPRPSLLYRQHGANQVGANDTTRARIARIGAVLNGRFAGWIDVQYAALDAARDAMTPEARVTFDAARTVRRHGALGRLAGLWRTGLYRQTGPGSLALWGAALIGRL
ncbi:glycosyltransferase [Alphaproteobacteria bacterium GH1-50]|uniref:Glycosyltransferase n=1 Tax=Kangsaoukella pontilimi TaxID=2691042 RepID=A0A7C9MLC4_9RHOB|nr:glycosyltransferase family 2 protein [Kangsaoukella pontilimi]MXQ09135.1 glycosyltransferase [Kangsaoukella pontilimi]